MKINSKMIFFAIIIIIIGGILIANQLGLNQTFRKKEPRKNLKGEYDIADIRGSHTLLDIEKYFRVSVKDVIEAFGLPESIKPEIFKIKDFRKIFKPIRIGYHSGEVINLTHYIIQKMNQL